MKTLEFMVLKTATIRINGVGRKNTNNKYKFKQKYLCNDKRHACKNSLDMERSSPHYRDTIFKEIKLRQGLYCYMLHFLDKGCWI